MNTFTAKHLALLFFSFFAMFVSYGYAADSKALDFTSQTATVNGSNGSLISVDSNLSYINKGENSSIIGNYFSGYYYDSVLGYFEVDSLPNQSENVRVVGSTGKCTNGYGYKIGGYAYSNTLGYIDFDYDANIFVYYCEEDEQLYGHAYSSFLGFQSFEGITFDITVEPVAEPEELVGTGAFVNETTEILEEEIGGDSGSPGESKQDNSNFNYDSIQNDLLKFDEKYESLFYIIK